MFKSQRGVGVATAETIHRSAPPEKQEDSGLLMAANDLKNALDANDMAAAAAALRAAFEILDSQPHVEGPHTYESQNKL
jgi:hypothetical protein